MRVSCPKAQVKESSAKKATSLLKVGMSGAEVSKMQRKLRERGFPSAAVLRDITEIKTAEAVKAFQKKANMGADGVAGEKNA